MSDLDTIRLRCPHCGKRLRVKLPLAGKQVSCPNQACGKLLEVPGQSKRVSRKTTGQSPPAFADVHEAPFDWSRIRQDAGAGEQKPPRRRQRTTPVAPNLQASHLNKRNAPPTPKKKDETSQAQPDCRRTLISPVVLCRALAGLIVLAGIVTFAILRSPGERRTLTDRSEPSEPVDERPNTVARSQPPTIELVQVEPAEPRAKEDLRVWLRGGAADGNAVQFQYRTNSLDNWQSAPGGLVQIPAVQAGPITLQLRSVDSTGMPSPTIERSWNVKEPNRPPTVVIVRALPDKPQLNGSIRLELSGKDPDGDALTLRYRTSPTADWRNANAGEVVLSDLKAGEVWVQVQARDAHGLASEPLTRTWTIAPTIVTSAPLRIFKGHRTCAHGVVFTPDGARILSGSCDGTLRLWDTHTTDLLTDFAGVQGSVFALDVSPDGRFAVSGGSGIGRDRKPLSLLQLWDLASGKELRRMSGHTSGVRCLTISPDGKRVASGGGDGTVRLWEVETGRELHCFPGHKRSVQTVAFAPDGGSLLSAGGGQEKKGEPVDCALRLWDVATGREIASFSGHSHRVTSVAFLADARSAISSSGRVYQGDKDRSIDPFVRLWDLGSGKEVRRFMGSEEGVASVTVTFDKKYIFCACGDGKMRLRELEGGRELQRYEGHRKKVLCTAISRNSHYVVTGSEDGQLLLWDLPKEVHIPLESIPAKPPPASPALKAPVPKAKSLAFPNQVTLGVGVLELQPHTGARQVGVQGALLGRRCAVE